MALKRTLQILFILGVLFGIGELGYLAFNSPILKVATVTMIGNQLFKPEDVEAISALVGKNILTIDAQAVTRAVEQTPLVRRAVVSRQYSTRELVIFVEERQPYAVWQVKDVRYYVDDEGVIFQPAPSFSALPLIIDMDGRPLELGTRVDPKSVQLAWKLTETLPRDMSMSVKSFEYLRRGGLVAIAENGMRARFGDGSDFEFKLAAWKAILESASEARIKFNHADLRFGARPFIR
ncbi:MAG: FtsQ-type POTRA domain-containing protein [Chloroflexi bacterium]|nr:FtsQ-type POTRA domain-containing protein [Chloroflexota bacterium]